MLHKEAPELQKGASNTIDFAYLFYWFISSPAENLQSGLKKSTAKIEEDLKN
jgi:hypothetical protein